MGIKMAKIKVNDANRNLEITTTLAFIMPEEKEGCTNRKGLAMDIVGAFSTRLIASIERRQKACLKLLLKHEDDIVFNNGIHVEWKRKDGSIGYFNVPSFEAMNRALGQLRLGNYSKFVEDHNEVDQALKALLNDPVEFQDHSDAGGFTYANLISTLCELHFLPFNKETCYSEMQV